MLTQIVTEIIAVFTTRIVDLISDWERRDDRWRTQASNLRRS